MSKASKAPLSKMKLRNRTRITTKRRFLYAMSFSMVVVLIVFSISGVFKSETSRGATAGDFRSATSGNLNANATWETYNGTAWVAASSTPTPADGIVTIQSGHSVSVSANVSLDQIVVETGATLNINTGKNLTIANGTGTDFEIRGTLNIFGTVNCNASTNMIVSGNVILKSGGNHTLNGSSTMSIDNGGRYKREDASLTTGSGIITVNSGGVYQHNIDGQSIPLATWNTGSLCEITGVSTTKPNNLDQSFYSFTWNCPNQTSVENLAGKLEDVNGDLTFVSTGTGTVRLGQGENYNLTIDGNYYHQGGTVYASSKSQLCVITVKGNYVQSGGTFAGSDETKDNGEASPTINVEGNFSISSGTFDFNQHSASSTTKGITTLNLYGNYTQTGGTVTETATNTGRGDTYFAKSGTQIFTKTSGTLNNTINWIVNSGATLDMNTSILTSAGYFTLSSGAGLMMSSPNGITATAASGNIQVTGTRTYSTGASYTYYGSSSQVTGDGLPSTIQNLTVNSSAAITLSAKVSISSLLTFTAGNVITGSDTLILGTSTAVTGSLSRLSGHVIGNFKRWIAASATSNILFPVGISSYYEGLNYSFTSAPSTGGSVNVSYSATDPGKNGLPITDASISLVNIGYALWTTTPGNNLTGGTFSIDLTATALSGVTDATTLHLLRRVNSASAWTASGVHAAGTGSVAVPVVHRTGLTVHGQFGIGSGSSNPLPIELVFFKAELDDDEVAFHWATAAEVNNDYFTIERSTDGVNFEKISIKQGAGNSTNTINYSDVDKAPVHGVSYYRLKQTDYDGKFTYSEIETVKYEAAEKSSPLELLSAGPNPFNESFTLNFNLNKKAEVAFVLMNTSGQIVSQEKLHTDEGYNSYQYSDNAGLSKGIYFAYLMYDDKKIVQKLIKN